MTIDIIGAGIGGLSTAIALEKKGYQVRLYEQAPKIKPIGAGIILASNAMQVYQKLGLKEIIEKNGNPISNVNITTSNLKAISQVDLSFFEKKHGVRNIAIHRGVLQQILIANLKSSKVNLDHQLKKIIKTHNGHQLTFENGTIIQSSILLGADGIHSTVRRNLFSNNTIRNANQICWRGVVKYNLPEQFNHELNEAWGKSDRFGFVRIGNDKVYWYALKSFKKDKSEYPIKNIDKYFEKYAPLIKSIISLTPRNQINTAEISDLLPTKIWHKENLCLLGDAAHAATPNMGQGACQAIEDAYVLSECINKYPVDIAFQKFQKIRIPKAHQVVKNSWMLGKISHLSNPLLIGIRNQMMRLTPESINRKQSERLFQLETV